MGYFKWLAAGLIGASIGAAVWVAIGYYADTEVGYIAWGVGLLAGLAVRFAAGDEEGVGPGAAALVAATVAIAGAKYMVVSLIVEREVEKIQAAVPEDLTQEQEIAELAAEVVNERMQKNEVIEWPEGMDQYEASEPADYPKDVWSEAEKRYLALTATDKDQRRADRKQQTMLFIQALKKDFKQHAFQASFGPYDLLWFGLAAFTAFKVGSGAGGDD